MKQRGKKAGPRNLTFLKDYAGKWVALSASARRVVASGTSMTAAMREARRRGEMHPILIKSPSRSAGHYIFLAHGRL